MLAEWVFWDGQMMSRGESLCLVHGNDMAQELPMYRGDLERACIGDEKDLRCKDGTSRQSWPHHGSRGSHAAPLCQTRQYNIQLVGL
jgi:hypothetical protein